MAYGYKGQIARINLTDRTVKIEKLNENFYKKYLGGRNIAAYFMLKEIPENIDPLGSENKLVVTTSILTGTPIPGSARHTIAAKSPLTGGFGESEGGGFWGPELKFAGYDGLIIEGEADTPVYIFIKNHLVTIKDAEHLWGKETGEVQDIIRKENNDIKIRVLQTGIAGEKLVKFAAVTNELKHWCGRCGLGAVMGSKKLRAIAVRGTGQVQVKYKKKVLGFCKWFSTNMKKNEGLSFKSKYGTAGGVIPMDTMGLLPTHNFREGSFKYAHMISGEEMYNKFLKKREGCYSCPVRCKRVVDYKNSNIVIEGKYGGPEYESIGTLGSACEIGDLKYICKANELCGRFGLDTISTGMTIAFAMECFERGIITTKDTEGIRLEFGNGDALLAIIEKIAKREGFGNILAEGSYRAAQIIGRGAEKYSMTVKKQEFPAHEPRGKWGVGLGYAVSPSGADHLVAAHDPWFESEPDKEHELTYMDISPMYYYGIRNPLPAKSLSPQKIRLFVHLQYLWSLYNVLDLCIFIGVPELRMTTIDQIVELVNNVCGWDLSHWELVKTGEKGIQMARLFNLKQGVLKDQDTLPDRMFEPLKNGAQKGTAINKNEFKKGLEIYYEMMGWNKDGVPTLGKLAELGIEEFAK